MRANFGRSWIGLAAVFATACGPAPQPQQPTAVVTAPAVSAAPPSAPTPELGAVPDPDGLVLIARVRNPSATFASATQIAGLAGMTLPMLLRMAGGGERADLLGLDQSFDLAMTLDPASTSEDPKFLAAVSMPLRELERTRTRLAPDASPIAPGVYRGLLDPLDDGKGKKPGKDSVCDLAASAGEAPARLVCSESERELDVLRAWMTRTLPRTPPAPSDLHVELRARPFQDRFANEIVRGVDELTQSAATFLQTEAKIQDPELLEAPGIVLREAASFFNDVDAVKIDASVHGASSEASMRTTLAFRSTHGWYTRLLTHRNDRTGPPPSLFWRLPKDSDTALYGRGQDGSYYEGIYRVLRLATTRLLGLGNVSARSRAAVEDFLAVMPDPDVLTASASGSLPSAPASGEITTPEKAVKAFQSMAGSWLGWSVSGFEAPSAAYASSVRKGALALDLLLRELKMKLPAKDRTWVPTVRTLANPVGLPRGSVAVDLAWSFDSKVAWAITGPKGKEHPKGRTARGTLTLRVAVVPDGDRRTWIGFSADPATLNKHLAMSVASAPEGGTIAALPGLELLRREPAAYAGFLSYGAALERSLGMSGKLGTPDSEWLASALAALPNRLRTPMLLVGSGTTGPAPSSSLEVRLQKGSVEDLVALVRYAIAHRPPGDPLIQATP